MGIFGRNAHSPYLGSKLEEFTRGLFVQLNKKTCDLDHIFSRPCSLFCREFGGIAELSGQGATEPRKFQRGLKIFCFLCVLYVIFAKWDTSMRAAAGLSVWAIC